ncbi:hypothetical protein [Gordonia spumicola]|uniref:hypothetical protein n=1 Tax=Gordonia spumicola TaxID=589161 RepID=UPI001642DD0E|nr:hypothetical protein [Gordonia spumicola]
MSTYPPELDRWVAVVAPALGLGDDVDVPTELLLDVTRDVAPRRACPRSTDQPSSSWPWAAGDPAADSRRLVIEYAAIAER